MLRLFRRRRRPRAAAPTIRPRSETVAAVRVELSALTPAPEAFLGRAAYLALVLFEDLGRAVSTAPTTAAKAALGPAAAQLLEVHAALVRELDELGADPAAAMDPYRRELEEYRRRIEGADWTETLVTCYLTTGFLTDFFTGLAGGLPRGLADRVAAALDTDRAEGLLEAELRGVLERSPRLASRLALWGRRLIGDTMLVARAALVLDGAGAGRAGADRTGQDRIEPAFNELIGAHTRRMDALGLTA